MFYDSDDDDSLNGYLFNGYGYPDYDDYYDYFDYFGEYDSDEYNDYSFSSHNTNNDFCDMCHSPSLFPDDEPFSIGYAKRVSAIESTYDDFIPNTIGRQYYLGPGDSQSVSAKLDLPIFEHLWETLFYLKQITNIGQNRTKMSSELANTNPRIVTLWNDSVDDLSALPDTFSATCNHWYVWCNDLLIEFLGSLIPFRLPYTSWQLILHHLSTVPLVEAKHLLTSIGTISKNERTQIAERFVVRKCICSAIEFIKAIYGALYGHPKKLYAGDIKKKLPGLFSQFCNSMERFYCFVNASEPESKCILHSIESKSVHYFGDTNNEVIDLDCIDEVNILTVTGSTTSKQNGSDYFTLLIHNELLGKSGQYDLLCIDKNSVKTEIRTILMPGATESFRTPFIFNSFELVATVGYDRNGQEASFDVWDISEKNPEHSGNQAVRIFSSNYKHLIDDLKASAPEIDSPLHAFRICGLSKIGDKLQSVFSVMAEESPIPPFCVTASYQISDTPNKSVTKQKLHQTTIANAIPLGVSKNTAIVMHLDMGKLCAYDGEILKENLIGEDSFRCDKDWGLQFNSDPACRSFILHKENKFQLRKLDKELSICNSFTLSHNHLLDSYNEVEYQLSGTILYGFLNHQADLNETEKIFKDAGVENDAEIFLYERFGDARVVHFSVDLEHDEKELVYLNVDKVSEHGTCDFHMDGTSMIHFSLSGFNNKQELVILDASVDVDDIFLDNDEKSAMTSHFTTQIIEFHGNFQDWSNIMSPDVDKVILAHEKETILREKALKQIQERQKQADEKKAKEKEKKKKKREAKKARNTQQKMQKWQTQAHEVNKQKKRPTQEQNAGSSKESDMLTSVMKEIKAGKVFQSIINVWITDKHFGFSTIDLPQGTQSVFVHKSNFPKRDQRFVGTGSVIEFQLTWNQVHPRPKAINIRLLL